MGKVEEQSMLGSPGERAWRQHVGSQRVCCEQEGGGNNKLKGAIGQVLDLTKTFSGQCLVLLQVQGEAIIWLRTGE